VGRLSRKADPGPSRYKPCRAWYEERRPDPTVLSLPTILLRQRTTPKPNLSKPENTLRRQRWGRWRLPP